MQQDWVPDIEEEVIVPTMFGRLPAVVVCLSLEYGVVTVMVHLAHRREPMILGATFEQARALWAPAPTTRKDNHRHG